MGRASKLSRPLTLDVLPVSGSVLLFAGHPQEKEETSRVQVSSLKFECRT